MIYYLMICRSLTHAQRLAQVLEKSGIFTKTIRSPKNIDNDGCSYAIRIPENQKANAFNIIKNSNISIKKIFILNEDGSLREAK